MLMLTFIFGYPNMIFRNNIMNFRKTNVHLNTYIYVRIIFYFRMKVWWETACLYIHTKVLWVELNLQIWLLLMLILETLWLRIFIEERFSFYFLVLFMFLWRPLHYGNFCINYYYYYYFRILAMNPCNIMNIGEDL
jgi:hypothetical protein